MKNLTEKARLTKDKCWSAQVELQRLMDLVADGRPRKGDAHQLEQILDCYTANVREMVKELKAYGY